jgi:hypothetical protein
MLAIDRWRNWRPLDEKSNESLGCEPPKPSEHTSDGFEGSFSGRMQNFSSLPPDAPDAWREDFARWRTERCVSRQSREDSAGIGCLWVDFCEWAVGSDSVPCTRATFERLLSDAGFRCADGMANGLLLRVDMEAVLRFQAAPEASGQSARATTGKRSNAERRQP